MSLTLRPYQQDAVDAAWLKLTVSDNALIVMSCGLGKTEVSFGLFKRAVQVKPAIRICFVVNRLPLLSQTFERLSEVFPPHWCGLYFGKKKERDKPITVGTVQSLVRADLDAVDLVLFDECHRVSTEKDSLYAKFLAEHRKKNEKLKVVGLTATPYKATGLIYGEEDSIFDVPCFERGVKWALENNYLVPPRMKRVDEQFETAGLKIIAGDFDTAGLEALATEDKIRAQVKDALPRLEGRKKIVWSCTGIKHADLLSKILEEYGEISCSYHYKTEDQPAVMDSFKQSGRHMAFVSIVSEGWDFPECDAICLCRPTRSPVRYVQTVGRAMRLHELKTDALVLDYGGVVENCGPIDSPVIPKKGQRNKVADKMKFCPKCYEYMEKTVEKCPCCGYVEPPKPKREIDGTKKLLTRHKIAKILSDGEIKREWIEIDSVFAEKYKTRNGSDSIRITYKPKNIFRAPIKQYAVFGSGWLNKKAHEKLRAIGIVALSYEDALKKQPTKRIAKIKVKWGSFPEIEEHEYAS